MTLLHSFIIQVVITVWMIVDKCYVFSDSNIKYITKICQILGQIGTKRDKSKIFKITFQYNFKYKNYWKLRFVSFSAVWHNLDPNVISLLV